jgi:hypothetical protein
MVGASCMKCGVVGDKSKWYAIADEAEAQEKKRPVKKAGAGPTLGAKPSSAARADWYKAAGMDVPEDAPVERASALGDTYAHNDPERFVEVAKGRRDPPFKLIAGGIGVALVAGGLLWYAGHGLADKPAPTFELPTHHVEVDTSYGFKVDPPEGFKQQTVPEPEFLRGVHGELTHMVAYRDGASGIDAFYFGEVKQDTNLDSYATLSVSDLGKTTALSAVPEGMKAYPTKGFLIDMGARKAMVYVAAAKPNRYLSVFVVAPPAAFDKQQERVEAAARAFAVVEPTGPHPGMQFAPSEPE